MPPPFSNRRANTTSSFLGSSISSSNMPPPFSNRRVNTPSSFLGSSMMSSSTRRSRADSSIFNTSTMSTTTDGFLGGYDVKGEEIQKRLNSAQRKKTFPKTTKEPKFTGYTMSEDELLPFLGAKYENGRGQFWAIIEIIKFSKNKELPFKHIYQIYYYLYKHVLDEKAVSFYFITFMGNCVITSKEFPRSHK
uniref:Uncharacterized protein n=1 Tax=Panagrolaimus davidi TaxID=227884 RepID=A0A914QLJ9_9BILA